MIHGYVTLAINGAGNKAHIVNRKCHDERMENYIEWGDIPLEELLIPDGVTDSLVMVFFSYQSLPSFNGESSEYDDDVTIENFVIMQSNYKEFWRSQISFLITHDGHALFPREFEEFEQEWVNELLEDWQVLYDEVFVLDPKYNAELQKEELDTDISCLVIK